MYQYNFVDHEIFMSVHSICFFFFFFFFFFVVVSK